MEKRNSNDKKEIANGEERWMVENFPSQFQLLTDTVTMDFRFKLDAMKKNYY